MGDLTSTQVSEFVKVIGSDSSGTETYPVKVSANNDIHSSDILTTTGVDGVIALTATPVELKVGVGVLSERKYVILEGLDNNIKWGFSNSTQSFDLFKNQILMIPLGPNISIWAKMSTGTGNIAFGELS